MYKSLLRGENLKAADVRYADATKSRWWVDDGSTGKKVFKGLYLFQNRLSFFFNVQINHHKFMKKVLDLNHYLYVELLDYRKDSAITY